MTGITVLGSTGSIGVNTLDVLSRHRERFRVVALTARRDYRKLHRQCQEHRPDFAVLVDEDAANEFAALQKTSGVESQLLVGEEALARVAAHDDAECVMAAIVGAAGLLPTLAAARAGKRVLLANKEALVVAGRLLVEAIEESGALLVPIDSEHNAIFQCMPEAGRDEGPGVRRIILTASGGPFLDTPLEDLAGVTPADACAHPNWVMGRKISVDSATMMNKGLEVIEACWLFDVRPERVEVVVHPQSIVHSMVDYVDGSVLAQMGNPDMRTPIAHALAWPERVESGVEPLDIVKLGRLDFRPPDYQRFPCLRLAREAAETGGTAPAVLNAANEVAVAAFLENKVPFTAIPRVIESTLEQSGIRQGLDLDGLLEEDAAARRVAAESTALHGEAHA